MLLTLNYVDGTSKSVEVDVVDPRSCFLLYQEAETGKYRSVLLKNLINVEIDGTIYDLEYYK